MTQLDEGYRDLGSLANGDIHDVDGHAVAVDFPHEVIDSFRTDWGQRCWDESFARQLPVMVWNHNPDLLIGAGVRGEFLPRENVTRVVQRFANFDKVPDAQRAHSLIEDKIVPGFSFHYRDGRTISHPTQRGARRFTKARMLEMSPVTFPSIPGAVAVGLRSQEDAIMEIPTIEELVHLRDIGVLKDDGLRSAIAEHYPNLREHITVAPVAPSKAPLWNEDGTLTDGARAELGLTIAKYEAAVPKDGKREVAIAIHHDGSVTDGDGNGIGHPAPDDDVAQLAAAVDAALDSACSTLGDTDVTTLPDNVQQALALMNAAGSAVDELLDAMGVPDADDGDEGGRAVVEGKARDALPDSDFAYIEPGGVKDASGKTVPRSKRHFPIMDAEHVRNALARIAQGAKFGAEAKPKVLAAAKKFGIHVDDEKRSELIDSALGKINSRIPAA